VYVILKARRGVYKAERHNSIFEVAITGAEGRFLLIAFLNTDSVVGVLDVNLTEIFCVSKPIEDLRNEGERVTILHRDIVEPSVVYAKTKTTILFWNEED
jgi:hypothetical protein